MDKHNRKRSPTPQLKPTSWEPVGKWYSRSVGDEGHYYHQHVVIPGVLRLLELDKTPSPSLLDIACGQGVLARQLPESVEYTGIDISPTLIKEAKAADKNPKHRFLVSDAMNPFPLEPNSFTHAAIVLAIQNIEAPERTLRNAAIHLAPHGHLVIAMNHPCFRIPRQSSWEIDEEKKVQYRRIDRYSSPMDIPIQAHPSKGTGSTGTWSFHRPLAAYSRWLFDAGFSIDLIEEWHSDKTSTGGAAKMENRSRAEFPLFLAIKATKR